MVSLPSNTMLPTVIHTRDKAKKKKKKKKKRKKKLRKRPGQNASRFHEISLAPLFLPALPN